MTSENAIDGLLFALWRTSWQGTLVFCMVWAVCRVLARHLSADTQCSLWRLSYVKLLVGLLWGGVVLLPLLSPVLPSRSLTSPQTAFAQKHVLEQPVLNSDAAAPIPVVPIAKPVVPIAKRELSGPLALAIVYVFGVVFCLGRLLFICGKTRQVLRSPATDAVALELACAAKLAQGMKLRRTPILARSAAVGSPVFLAGRVLLPADAQYSEVDLQMILAHELAHARRRDLLWEWLGTLVQVVFFFHPFVVLARREERLAREAAADTLALEATGAHAADYGKLLLSLALRQTGPRPMLIGAVGVIEGGTLLRRRLLALRDAASRTGSRRSRRRIALTLVPLLTLVFVPWQVTHGQAPSPKLSPRLFSGSVVSNRVRPNSRDVPVGNKTIAGVIRNENGEPVADMDVILDETWSHKRENGGMASSTFTVNHVSTNAQGRFVFSKLPAGNFDCEVSSPTDQYAPAKVPLIITKSDFLKPLRIVVSTGCLITGRVIDKHTGEPMPGVLVSAGTPQSRDKYWAYIPYGTETTTDAQGHYQVRVAPGHIYVGAGEGVITTNPNSNFSIRNSLLNRRILLAGQDMQASRGQTAAAPDISVSLRPVIVCLGPDGKPVAGAQFDHFEGGGSSGGDTDDKGMSLLGDVGTGTFTVVKGSLRASGTYRALPDGSLVITTNNQTTKDQATSYPSGIGVVYLAKGT